MDGKSKAIPEPVCCDRHIGYKKKAGKIKSDNLHAKHNNGPLPRKVPRHTRI